MSGYKAFYRGKETEVWADSLYGAKLKAVQFFKPKKKDEHLVTVILCEKDGKIITHSTTEV